MIGLVASPKDQDVAAEFFELFKTPWEPYREGQTYDVLLVAGMELPPNPRHRLWVVYGNGISTLDRESKLTHLESLRNPLLAREEETIPIYGDCLVFEGTAFGLSDRRSGKAVAVAGDYQGTPFVRLGFDLFEQVRFLLTEGQPTEHARRPTLESHIAFLREVILDAGIPLVEIPPKPIGHPFIVCLTHDVDHPRLRLHGFDHTSAGFLFRASIGSIGALFRGRLSMSQMLRNFAAVLRWPFVLLGWARDFWRTFPRYLQIEKGLGSTFYFIPRRGDPGRVPQGVAPARRASGYGASDLAVEVKELCAAGCEIGVHGLDAWLDPERGREEQETLAKVTGQPRHGVRMHWLYFNAESPRKLEEAGYLYDSTFGYNGTVGYRAGTLQAFKPLGTEKFLELPLHVMDTALFYPSHLHLSRAEAQAAVWPLIEDANRFGGTLTVNWHDRSIAPERQWEEFYTALLTKLKRRGAWFPTATRAAQWFRKRRSATFTRPEWEGKTWQVHAGEETGEATPDLCVRVYRSNEGTPRGELQPRRRGDFTDIPLKQTVEVKLGVA